MDKAFFKITIPNYNGMAYVRQCLDSIFGQTFQDFFVVFVDDQSTDLSYEFAKMYERKYPGRMKALRVPEKKMAGGCRNVGIDYPVECEYMYFMDSDDYLYSKDSLQKLHNIAYDLKNEVILFDWARDFNGTIKKYKFPQFESCLETLAGRANNPNNGNCCYWCSAWSKIVRADKIQKFLEKQCMCGEDTYQWVKMMDVVDSYKQIHDVIYVYRDNPTGTINQKTVYNNSKATFYAELKNLLQEVKRHNVKTSILNRLKYN